MNYEQGIAFSRRVLGLKDETYSALDKLLLLHNALEGCMDPCHGDVEEIDGAWRWWDARRTAWTGEYPGMEAAQAAANEAPSAPVGSDDVADLFDGDDYWQLPPPAALAAMREVLAVEAAGVMRKSRAVALLYALTDERLDLDKCEPPDIPAADMRAHLIALEAIAHRIEAEVTAEISECCVN